MLTQRDLERKVSYWMWKTKEVENCPNCQGSFWNTSGAIVGASDPSGETFFEVLTKIADAVRSEKDDARANEPWPAIIKIRCLKCGHVLQFDAKEIMSIR